MTVDSAGSGSLLINWANVKPFVLVRASQFRPPAPAPLNITAYLKSVQEVESLGQNISATRSADQTTNARAFTL